MIGKGFFQKPEIKGAFILSCGTIVSLAMLCISFLVHKNSNLLVKYSQLLLERVLLVCCVILFPVSAVTQNMLGLCLGTQ